MDIENYIEQRLQELQYDEKEEESYGSVSSLSRVMKIRGKIEAFHEILKVLKGNDDRPFGEYNP